MELTGRVIEGRPFSLFVEVAVRLWKRARARISVALPEDVADHPIQERWTECPDPPCHEVMRFEFALRRDIRRHDVPIRVVAQTETEKQQLNLVAPVPSRRPEPGTA